MKSFSFDKTYAGMSIGDLLYEKIREEGVNIEYIITKSGINRAVLYDILKGNRRITAQSAFRLSDLTSFSSLDWIMYQAWNDYVDENEVSRLCDEGYDRRIAKQIVSSDFKKIIKKYSERLINETLGNYSST
jgi:plasmid maintenance system antidote protein VapI